MYFFLNIVPKKYILKDSIFCLNLSLEWLGGAGDNL